MGPEKEGGDPVPRRKIHLKRRDDAEGGMAGDQPLLTKVEESKSNTPMTPQ